MLLFKFHPVESSLPGISDKLPPQNKSEIRSYNKRQTTTTIQLVNKCNMLLTQSTWDQQTKTENASVTMDAHWTLSPFEASSPGIFFLTLSPATFSWCNNIFFPLSAVQKDSKFLIISIPDILTLLPAAALLPLSRLQGGRVRERASEREFVVCGFRRT